MKNWQEVAESLAPGDHAVQFYTDEAFLTGLVSRYASETISQGGAAILIATRPHTEKFLEGIRGLGKDPEELIANKCLILADAHESLDSFHAQGRFYPDRFEKTVGTLLDGADSSGPVRAYGEMVDILWQRGEHDAAAELERLWEKLLVRRRFSLLCAYAIDTFSSEIYQNGFLHVCQSHSTVLSAEDTQKFEDSVWLSLRETLGPSLTSMVVGMSGMEQPACNSESQNNIFWLYKNMPLTANRILALGSRRYHS